MENSSLIGTRFGLLTVIGVGSKPIGRREKYLLCKCDCGKITNVSYYRLKTNRTLSCGCLQRNKARKRNNYLIEQNIAKVFFNDNTYFTIDLDDLEKVLRYYWVKSEYGYVVTSLLKDHKVIKIRLHRFLMGITDKNIQIDHINQDKLDNRKINLRKATPMENANNRHKCKSWNKLGIKNISKVKDSYMVRLTIMGKKYSRCGIKSIEEAQAILKEIKENYNKEKQNG